MASAPRAGQHLAPLLGGFLVEVFYQTSKESPEEAGVPVCRELRWPSGVRAGSSEGAGLGRSKENGRERPVLGGGRFASRGHRV